MQLIKEEEEKKIKELEENLHLEHFLPGFSLNRCLEPSLWFVFLISLGLLLHVSVFDLSGCSWFLF